MTEQRRRLEPLRLDPHRPGVGPPQTAVAPRSPAQAVPGGVPAAPPPPLRPGRAPWVVIAIVMAALVVVGGIGTGAFLLLRGADDARAPTTYPTRAPTTPMSPAVATNDGTDGNRPILPDVDKGFVDTRGGWGWGDRCWINLKAGKWGWAKAECDQGMAMNPASPQPRASLLYNEGLVAKAAGRIDEARQDFTSSLALRENAEVRAALNSLSGGKGSQ